VPWNGKCRYILWPFVMFCGHLYEINISRIYEIYTKIWGVSSLHLKSLSRSASGGFNWAYQRRAYRQIYISNKFWEGFTSSRHANCATDMMSVFRGKKMKWSILASSEHLWQKLFSDSFSVLAKYWDVKKMTPHFSTRLLQCFVRKCFVRNSFVRN
jgi:hypothetical protein